MRSFNNMLCEVNDTVTEYVNDNLEQIRADKAGLDARCGRIWVCLDCIAVERAMTEHWTTTAALSTLTRSTGQTWATGCFTAQRTSVLLGI